MSNKPLRHSESKTNEDLKNYVLRHLGYPTRNVELTEEQLDDCIEFAIQEVQPWYTVTEYLTFDLNNRTVIDLSEYNVFEILDIFKMPSSALSGNLNPFDDPFNYTGMAVGGLGITAGYIGSQIYISRLTNSDIHHVISTYAKQYNELFYSKLAQMVNQRTASTILPTMNYEYDRITKKLYIAAGYPPSTILTLEYVPYVDDFSKIKDNRYKRCCQDLALGQAMSVLSRVVGKYNVSNAPATINYEIYREDSERLIEHAREELKRISLTTYVTD